MKHLYSKQLFNNAALLLCLATLGWAGNIIAGRMAVGETSPMVIVFLRWTIVAMLLFYTQRRNLPSTYPLIRPRLLWVFVMSGFGLTGFNVLFYSAAQYTSAVNLGIFQSSLPIFILLGMALLYQTGLSLFGIIGTILTIAGVIAIIGKGDIMILATLALNPGDALMIIACIFYSCYTIGLKSRPKLDNIMMMTFLAGAAWLLSLPLLLAEIISGRAIWPDKLSSWLIVLYIALIPSLMSQVFYMRGVDLIGPGKAGIYINLVPIFSGILAIIILGEAFQLYHLAAILLVFVGIAIISKSGDIHGKAEKKP